MQFGIRGFKRPNRFKKAYQSLDRRIQEEVEAAIRDLCKNPVPRGRRVRKMQGYDNPAIWEVRLTSSFRMTFSIDDTGIVRLRNVGTHAIYESP